MSIIKIGVACHKPSELPQNDLFLPIQVGAALSSIDLGIQRDDEGENISIKNKQYCELTAQYWLWKNVTADYYGLCHYRRFLCFSDKAFKKNERNQIIASVIDEESKKLYELENYELMRKEIESNDIILGEMQDISRLDTPRKSKKYKRNNVYEHWVAHHRDLIMKSDLDEMLNIIDEFYPEIGKCTREYLHGYNFFGFNCFILRKDLFHELCELEFRVLEELEKRVDLEKYNVTLTRIYGYMGEIISSAYFYFLEKKGIYKIKHIPLVFFNYTDKLPSIMPYTSEKENIIPICFNLSDSDPEKFGVVWQSFLDHIDPAYYYDVVLLVDILPKKLIHVYQKMAEIYTNVVIRIVEAHVYRTKYDEKYEITSANNKNSKHRLEEFVFSTLPFVPLILSNYDRMVVVDENIIICDSLIDLWEKQKKDNNIISAAHNTYIQGLINDVFYETMEEHLEKVMKDPLQFFSCNLVVWNFKEFRDTFTEEIIFEKYLNDDKTFRNKEEILNILCEDHVTFIDTRWATWIESNSQMNIQLAHCPAKQYEQLQIARKNPGAIVYLEDDPWIMQENELYYYFWPTAQKVETLYSRYLYRASCYSDIKATKINHNKSFIDEIYSSYSYRLGNVLIQPFHWGKVLVKWIQGCIKKETEKIDETNTFSPSQLHTPIDRRED